MDHYQVIKGSHDIRSTQQSYERRRRSTVDKTSTDTAPERHSTWEPSEEADIRKDSLIDQAKQHKSSMSAAPAEPTDRKRSNSKKLRSRNEPRHIYLCAHHDDQLTSQNDNDRRQRGHLAFKWDIFVKREPADASGTRFHLTTRYVRPRGTAIAGLDWEFQVTRWTHSDSSMVMCMRIGTARYRHVGALGEHDKGEDDEDEIEELCRRTEVDTDMTTWEWATAAVERLWQSGIIWRHAVYEDDHSMFAPLGVILEDAYQAWRATASQVRRRRPMHVVYPGLEKLSCDEEALQDRECRVCRRPRYGFCYKADARWLMHGW